MQASFIVPLYNCLDLTKTMLASLLKTLPSNFHGEIIFVDDCSTDGTREWLKILPNAEPVSPLAWQALLNEKNQGFAATCNHGAAVAKGELLFFLNNDLILQPGWLEPILAAFSRFPKAGLVGNIQRNITNEAIDHAGIHFNLKGKPEHDRTSPWLARLTGYRHVPALTGACFAIRRKLWCELSGFDEGFINGAEDVDLCLRAESAGWLHYIALRSVVLHHISASAGRKLRDEQNTHRLVQRWRDKIVQLSARDWARNFIVTHWDKSSIYDDALGREALYYWLGISRVPSPRLIAGVQASVKIELERWGKMAAASSN